MVLPNFDVNFLNKSMIETTSTTTSDDSTALKIILVYINNDKKKLVTQRMQTSFGLGSEITNENVRITDSCLPTCIQVLR